MFAVSLLALAPGAEARCTALADASTPRMMITEAASVSGTCRVTGVASPAPGSRIGFELRLPERGWTGRYVQIGTGGFAGTIFPGALAAEAARGNVAAMTDSGHVGDRMSAAWAAGNRPAIVDYGHRSIKATADAAHRLVRAYYGRPARWRYFVGCSNGGRQGLVAARRYPQDWDGILAGSPANPWSEQLRRFAELHYRLRAPGLAGLAAKLPAIQQAALASCPPGQVWDGVARDPRLCRFQPEAADLSASEAGAVRAIVAAGYEPTSAAQADGWSRWIVGRQPGHVAFAEQAFRYLLQSRPGWSIADFDVDAARRAAARAAPILDASPDFRRFRAKGGRILSYFGWADALIAPRLALDFYGRSGTAKDFYRLFMIPGMGHCQGGVGPVDFGQSANAPAAASDAEHDIRLALEQWVEQGRAPELLIASDPETGREARIPPEPG